MRLVSAAARLQKVSGALSACARLQRVAHRWRAEARRRADRQLDCRVGAQALGEQVVDNLALATVEDVHQDKAADWVDMMAAGYIRCRHTRQIQESVASAHYLGHLCRLDSQNLAMAVQDSLAQAAGSDHPTCWRSLSR